MKNIILIFNLILLLVFGFTELSAQESVLATGGDAVGSGGSVSYSVGQVVYTTKPGNDGKISEGVQQPYEIFLITGIEDAFGIKLECSAYPNPITDFLTLQIGGSLPLQISFSLFDMEGRLIKNKIISDNNTKIQMSDLVSATYFLHVSTNDRKIKAFKIVKK